MASLWRDSKKCHNSISLNSETHALYSLWKRGEYLDAWLIVAYGRNGNRFPSFFFIFSILLFAFSGVRCFRKLLPIVVLYTQTELTQPTTQNQLMRSLFSFWLRRRWKRCTPTMNGNCDTTTLFGPIRKRQFSPNDISSHNFCRTNVEWSEKDSRIFVCVCVAVIAHKHCVSIKRFIYSFEWDVGVDFMRAQQIRQIGR